MRVHIPYSGRTTQRGGNFLNGFKDLFTEICSRSGLNLAFDWPICSKFARQRKELSLRLRAESQQLRTEVVLIESQDQIMVQTVSFAKSLGSGCALHGYLARTKTPTPWHYHRALRVGLL